MDLNIKARIRGLFAGNYSEDTDEQIQANSRGDLLVAQTLPERTEIVRLGDSWAVMTATAISSLTGIPTTTAALGLWNGEQSNGKTYIIDRILCLEIAADTTQVNATALFFSITRPPVTAPTDAALTIRSLSGRNAYSGRARTIVNASITNDGWFPAGNSSPMAPAVAGTLFKTTEVAINGGILVPPGGQFNLHAAKAVATATSCHFMILWHEAQLIVRS